MNTNLLSTLPRLMHAAARRGAATLLGLSLSSVVAGASPPLVPISQVPMTIAVPANPQIVFAFANSQSMDGNLSGAIMTGSGMLGGDYSPPNGYGQLNNSTSPRNYTIPASFVPPVNPGALGVAPYTVASGGNLVDNSASRLNVAKQGLSAVIQSFIQSADFALVDYNTGGAGEYETWVYLMSPQTPTPQPFTFTNNPGLNRVVANPCYQWESNFDWVGPSCAQLQGYYSATSQDVNGSQWLVIGASSDDPAINDVLYAPNGYAWPVCVVYGGPNPASPYVYSLWDYETGSIAEGYNSATPGCGGVTTTNPTNAGYVPYAPETMYVARGFGYYGGQSPNSGNVVVPMTSAGATPTAISVSAAIAAFAPYLAPETSNSGTPEVKAQAVQSPIAGLITGAKNYLQTNPASSNGCNPTQYVVLVTDGLPTEDLSGYSWPPLGSASATGYNVWVNFNVDGSLQNTNDQALTDTINVLAALNVLGIKTFVLGVGAGVDPIANPTAAATLKAMAIAGGTSAQSPAAFGYFAATSPTDLIHDMQVILATILAQTQATSSAAVNSTGLNTGTVIYQAQFVTSDLDLDWTGELYAFPVAADGSVSTNPTNALWSAKHELSLQNWNTGRAIATWDPNANAGAGGGTPFRWNAALAPAGISATTALGAALSTFYADTNGKHALDFVRGGELYDQANGGHFRDRTWALGDIVDSNPLYVGPPTNSSIDPTYVAFAAANVHRPPVIYVGANDGMLHAFDATTGAERFAYVPNGVWSNLVNLVNPYYNQQHLFFVNGSPQAADVKFSNNTWHTVLAGNEGAGGMSIFALDVTNPAAMSAPGLGAETALAAAVLWEFTDADMGYSYSEPAIVSTHAGNLTFFGNGYDSPNSKSVLYAINTQTGALVEKIDLCAAEAGVCNAALANGLSSVTVVNTSGQITQSQNMVYAGDLQGNVWRIDISSAAPASWVVKAILQARDPSGVAQPITTAPAVTLDPKYPNLLGTMVFVGTGQLLSAADLSNTQIQTMYGIYDPPSGYASPIVAPTGRLGGPLVQQVLSSGTTTTLSSGSLDVRYVTSNTVNLPTKKGWYVDLNLTDGERVVTQPLTEPGGDLVFTTYFPNANFCTGGGSSWLMVLNYANGGAFGAPQIDTYGSGSITGQDANAAGMSLGLGFASAPVILTGGSNAAAPRHKEIVKGDTSIQGVAEAGAPNQRISWQEVR